MQDQQHKATSLTLQRRNPFRIKPLSVLIGGMLCFSAAVQASPFFIPGNLVVSVEGNGVEGATSGSYTDNQAAPLSLFQFQVNGTSSATYVNSLVLPQTSSGSNSAISGEYGSSSEGSLQLSGNGQYLTIMGYGVNAAAFNANPGAYSPDPSNTALGQSGSMTNQSSYTPVARVVALINANGNVDTSTAVYNVFNANNPRSAYTADGKTIYISGQGTAGDSTGGVFVTQKGSNSATSVTGNDAGGGSSQDTRFVTAYNGQLYVSSDSKKGSTNRDFVGTLGTAGSLPSGQANGGNGPTQLSGFGSANGKGTYAMTAANGNGLNTGKSINLSPADYFFANSTTLYVADTGAPKNTAGATSTVGDGGLQKWSLVNGSWVLDYTIAAGLNLVTNTSASGTTGLYGLTGETVTVNGLSYEEIFATNYTVGDTDPTYLYGLSDLLSATTRPGGESFTMLAAAPTDSNFKGVSFAPTGGDVPEPASLLLFAAGLAGASLVQYKRKY